MPFRYDDDDKDDEVYVNVLKRTVGENAVMKFGGKKF
jgi:hypothetical protein